MLTLEQAINHCNEKTEELKKQGLIRCDSLEDTIRAEDCLECAAEHEQLAKWLTELAERREADRWIPVSERTPDDLEPVNITWINHEPEPYYKEIKDKPFTATGIYFNGQWYWWSTFCADILAEYSFNYGDIIDRSIEVTHWKPLPEPCGESEDSE